MEDPVSFAPKNEDDMDVFKHSGSEEDDIGYHSIGRNIKVIIVLLIALKGILSINLKHVQFVRHQIFLKNIKVEFLPRRLKVNNETGMLFFLLN